MQHPPVFTLGMNSQPEHLLNAGDIPVVPTERGGQITYHGPGQIMAYLMLDLRARRLGIRTLVERIEDALIACLGQYGITAFRQEGAPGIYVLPGQNGPVILLSGKTQKDKIILLEALYNRTSGVHFQKASPPNQKGLVPVVLFVVLWQGCSPMFCRDFP